MPNDDRVGLGSAADGGAYLNCHCGFFTSIADYMLLHLREQCGAEWTDGQRALVRHKIASLEARIRAAHETITLGDTEVAYLRKIFQHKPEARPRDRACGICKRPTKEMFGGTPQCAKHVANGNAAVTSILAELMYGNGR